MVTLLSIGLALGLQGSLDNHELAREYQKFETRRQPGQPLMNPAEAEKSRALVLRLLGDDKVITAADLYHASRLSLDPASFYENQRLTYELTLCAAIRGHREARKRLPGEWDVLHLSMGSGQRLGVAEQALADRPGKRHFLEMSHLVTPGALKEALLDIDAAAAKANGAEDNPELKILADEDQKDRQNWSEAKIQDILARDKDRRTRALAILEEGGVVTARDYSRVGLIFQHGVNASDFSTAHECGIVSALLGDDVGGASLCSVSYDRLAIFTGRRQRFGTQLGPFLQYQDTRGVSRTMGRILLSPSAMGL